MSILSEQILDLRKNGYSYRKIAKFLNCSYSIVCRTCDPTQKEKSRLRVLKKGRHPFHHKMCNFKRINITTNTKPLTKTQNIYKLIQSKILYFTNQKGDIYMKPSFTVQDLLNKFGNNPVCYLTGESIDIYKPRTYHFDHIIPRSRGGTNDIDNLGICTKAANQAKNDMTPDEFFNLCKVILEYNGYQVSK